MDDKDKLIVVVEDDDIVNESLCDLLSLNGYQVMTSKNGSEGLDLIRREAERIQLVISDIMMPVMDGIILLKTIKKERELRSIPFIFLTAKNDLQTLKESFRNGVVDYIEKPFKNQEVIAIVENSISGKLKNDFASEIEHELSWVEQKLHKINHINSHGIRHSNAKILSVLDLLENRQLSNEEGISIISGMGKKIDQQLHSVNQLINNNEEELLPEEMSDIFGPEINDIWLVDDDLTINFINQKIIERNAPDGIKVSSFSKPAEALELIIGKNEIPGLILLDINMPEISGFDFLDRLESAGKQVNIIMLSSSVDARDISRAIGYDNVVSYLSKPLQNKDIQKIFTLQSNRQTLSSYAQGK